MTGAQHRHEVAARAAVAGLQVAREQVELADRALEVLLTDLVVSGGHPADRVHPGPGFSLPVHHPLRPETARATLRPRVARRGPRGGALLWGGFRASAWAGGRG